MGIITTNNYPKALRAGVRTWWGVEYAKHPPQWTDLFDQKTSELAYEEDVQETGFGYAVKKEETQSITYDTSSQGYVVRYTPSVWALGFMVSLEAKTDNIYKQVAYRRATANAFSMNQTKEVNHANMYNRAFNASYTMSGGDGKELLATDHPSLAGDWSNELDPASDICEEAIEDLCLMIMQAENSKGMKISLNPVSLHVHPANWFEANRILKSTEQYDTANNSVNVLKMTNALPGGIKVNQYFDDPDAFFIRTNCPNGLNSFQRWPLKFDEDNDFDTKNDKYASIERYSLGWTDPLALFGSAGA